MLKRKVRAVKKKAKPKSKKNKCEIPQNDSSVKFSVGDLVQLTNTKCIPTWIKILGVKKNKTFVVRSIGERTGGLRLEGIVLYRDTTDYEKAFDSNRFKKVRK